MPRCDECIAVYGKFLNATASDSQRRWPEMFVDTTPGTPPIYREEALRKLFLTGYDVARNVIFGSDSCPDDYNVAWVQEWLQRDRQILRGIDVSDETIAFVQGGNLLRFIGAAETATARVAPRPGM